ncbi:MAG: ABC transporter permease [Candidatus Tectomicrobia bacterium]|nr:ABC transporter permease [Candidatus Tectomicrobia bacterium]
MRRYVLRRLALTIPAVLGVMTVVFLTLHLIPGDPVESMLGEMAQAADKAALRRQLGLDAPLHVQYLRYLGRLAQGDLGRSLSTREPVLAAIARTLPATILLTVVSLAVAILLAVPLGILAAARHNTLYDHGSMLLALLGISMPNFWLGPLLIIFFAIELRLLPVSGFGGAAHVVLPALTLGSALAAILTRMTRASVLDVLGSDYLRTARAKGLRELLVLFKHALANALIPLVTVLGLQFGALLSGAIITETIFAWPGIGRLVIQAIQGRDFPLVQGCVLVIALGYVLVNLVVDVLYVWIDPRLRLAAEEESEP